ncbi:MAG TPA: AAA family ATPase, partial [Nocardioides sp.]|nr:AAA family ATPase [Nocardioides sp.]
GQPTADDRVRAYYAIRTLLEVLAAQHPVVLVLDDLHWADRGSVELVAHLIRRPPRTPVLLVATYRDRQVDPDLALAVERAASEGMVDVRPIGPLSAGEAEELVGHDGAVAQHWHQLSGGNPLLLLELGRAGGELASEDGVSAAVASAIGRELRPLGGPARTLVESAAAVGDPFDFDLAVATAGLDHQVALAALDEIASHGLVRHTELPRRFAFRHPLVRHAVYATLRPGQQLAANERIAAVLLERGATPAERARHVEQAARPGDLDAIALLADAAEEVAARAPASAVRWLQSAERLLPARASDEERLRLLEPRPALHLSLGELDEAHDCLVRALALVPDDDRTRRTQLATTCAGVEQLLGRYVEASNRLEECLAELPPDADEEAVSVSVALVMDCFYRREHDAMLAHGRHAVEVADANGDPGLRAAAHAALAFAGALTGVIDAARPHQAIAAQLVEGLSDDDLAARLDVLGMLGGAELYLEMFPETVAHGLRGLRIGRATGTTASAPTLIPCLGSALWVVGRIDDSIALFDEAAEAARASRDRIALVWRLLNLSFALVKAGEFEAALTATDEGLPLALSLADSVIVSLTAACMANAQLNTGDPAGALATLRRHCGPDLSALPGGWRTHYLDVAVVALLELDDLPEAERTAAVAREVGRDVSLPYTQAMAAASSARCLLRRGDAAAAAEAARAAVAACESVAARTDAALLRILLGEALARAGEVEPAVESLRTAADELDTMGAVRHRDRAELELGRLGHRPRRRTRG